MIRRLLFPLALGLSGVGVLLWLGVWQLQRLEWKVGILTEISARIAADPVPLAADLTEAADEYRAVRLSGTPTGAEVHVLASGTAAGTGYRVVSAFVTDEGRTILVDLGLLKLEAKDAPPALAPIVVEGNLLWPDDKSSSTPAPDLERNIWFARDLPAMAAHLGTEPVLVVLRAASDYDPRLTPVPVDIQGIKNDHQGYAVTWFLLAAVWAVMSAVLIARTLRQKD